LPFFSHDGPKRQIPVFDALNFGRILSFDRVNNTLLTGSSSTISPMSQFEETIPMPTTKHPQTATADTSPCPVSRRGLNLPQHHTHVQQVAECVHVDVPGGFRC
jgi:hypothetical protein